MERARATAEHAGLYEFVYPAWHDISAGDFFPLKEGASRIVVRRTDAYVFHGGALPIFDWSPDLHTCGFLRRIGNVLSEEEQDAMQNERRDVVLDSHDRHHYDRDIMSNLSDPHTQDDVRDVILTVVEERPMMDTQQIYPYFIDGYAWSYSHILFEFIGAQLNYLRDLGAIENPEPLADGSGWENRHKSIWRIANAEVGWSRPPAREPYTKPPEESRTFKLGDVHVVKY